MRILFVLLGFIITTPAFSYGEVLFSPKFFYCGGYDEAQAGKLKRIPYVNSQGKPDHWCYDGPGFWKRWVPATLGVSDPIGKDIRTPGVKVKRYGMSCYRRNDSACPRAGAYNLFNCQYKGNCTYP